MSWRLPWRFKRWRFTAPEEASRGAVPVITAKAARERMREGSPTSPRMRAATRGPTPGILGQSRLRLLELGLDLFVEQGDLRLELFDPRDAPAHQLSAYRGIATGQGLCCLEVTHGGQVGNLFLVAGGEHDEVRVSLVYELGAVVNELVTMV